MTKSRVETIDDVIAMYLRVTNNDIALGEVTSLTIMQYQGKWLHGVTTKDMHE